MTEGFESIRHQKNESDSIKYRKKQEEQMKKKIGKIILIIALLGISAFLLKGDVWIFWTWYLLAGVLGLLAMPVTGMLFSGFEDKGWMFSKVLCIAVTGFLTWFLVAVNLLDFTVWTCAGVVIVCALGCGILFRHQSRTGKECFPTGGVNLVFWEEILFFAIFLMWTYLAGFHPAAYGTEKFMDYGFMEAMMRSTELPAVDLWYSEGHINYYYGGQYFAVFLTKLSGSKPELTYNLMRTFVAAFAFVLPFSLVYQMTSDRLGRGMRRKKAWIPAVSGITAGVAVSIAGNMHYVIYGVLIPAIEKMTGAENISSYWFPDATRYIGYDPDVPDKTIHEFPCYSFVLGDLHAHVVNIFFVLLLMGLLYAWMQETRRHSLSSGISSVRFWKEQLLIPALLLVSLLLGMFQWTNFWDFVIYFVVTGGAVLFMNIVRFEGKWKTILAVTAAQAVEVLGISYLVILPFTLKFKTMVEGIALAQFHSLPYQLLVLWGLPAMLTILFLICVLREKLFRKRKKNLYTWMRSVCIPDLFAVIMGLCAIGLVIIPEIVYVRDIYENGYARANTMFKLTYQAYLLFGMTMGYVIYRMLLLSRQKVIKVLSGIGLFLLVCTCGYFGNSVRAWFGEVWKPEVYQGLNAVAYIETEFPEDAAGIYWLKENVDGSPVVLEANGDSYTAFNRVSAMTGLPTIVGWRVHEWLWRNDVEDLNEKSAEVETIYTSADAEEVKNLLEYYDVSYIFVGAREREKYGENLNEALLETMGEVVFRDENYGTWILKVNMES